MKVPALSLVLLAAAVPLDGQRYQRPPDRPKLSSGADTNDWGAYHDFGVSVVRERPSLADAAFYWASRLDPTRAEPYFGRWIAFWMANDRRWIDRLRGAQRPDDASAIRAADSLHYEALLRSPFVNQSMVVWLYDRLPGRWRNDPISLGWLAYGASRFGEAASHFGRGLKRDSVAFAWVRHYRAAVFVAMERYDSALAELTALSEELRRRGDEQLQSFYETPHLAEYGIAILHAVRNDPVAARAALERALVENLGFYPAYALRGRLNLAEGRVEDATRDFAQAVVLKGDDGRLRYLHGTALVALRRADEAVAELRQAVVLEPFYAPSYFSLGAALEQTGAKLEAATAYREFVLRAPMNAPERAAARARAQALAGGP